MFSDLAPTTDIAQRGRHVRSVPTRMAGRDGSLASGCGKKRANDVSTHWNDASIEPPRRTRVRQFAERNALGKAQAGAGSMMDVTRMTRT
jgi:hypothetical protein